MKRVNLYGHITTLDARHFRMQGYCEKTAQHGLSEIEAETYTPERAIAWLKTHIQGGCDQCKWANRIKMSIVDFLQEEFPERYQEWQQGRLEDPKIAQAWIAHLRENDPALLLWFLTHPKNFKGYEFFYEGAGSGKAVLVFQLKLRLKDKS